MKITTHLVEESTIEEFAEKYDLEMQVFERPNPSEYLHKFYAYFKNCETSYGGMLVGSCGDGPTPESAIEAYAKTISLKRIIINAYSPDRREISVPRLTPKHTTDEHDDRTPIPDGSVL